MVGCFAFCIFGVTMSVQDTINDHPPLASTDGEVSVKKTWSDPVCAEVKVAAVTAAMGAGGGDEAILS